MVVTEATYSVFGERGSIDILGWHPVTASGVVVEVKTSITSFEELQRRLDAKVRLAPGIIRERFGAAPGSIARVLIVDDTATNQRRVSRKEALFSVAFPMRSVALKRWLKEPAGDIGGLWFLSPTTGRSGIHGKGGTHRVRRPRSRPT
jgi:hypothetical protein